MFTPSRYRPAPAAEALRRIGEANATPYSRAVDAYARARQEGQGLGVGVSPSDAAAFLRPRICGFQLYSDPELAALLDLANDAELVALTQDPLTAQRIDEWRRSHDTF